MRDNLTLSAVAEGPLSALSGHSGGCCRMAAFVQGFGYRPVDDLSAGAEGRCPKAFREGTRGGSAGGLLSLSPLARSRPISPAALYATTKRLMRSSRA